MPTAWLLLPLGPYLLWLGWAALRYPMRLTYIWRSLWQRKAATLSTGVAIAVVVAIFVVVLSLSEGIHHALVSSGRPDQALVLRPSARTELISEVERDRARILKALPMIARDEAGPLISAECYVVIMIDKLEGGGSNVALRGLEPAGVRMRNQVRLVAGRWFKPGLPELVVPRTMTRRFANLEPGRTLTFSGRTWEIVGQFEAGGSAFESEIWTDVNELLRARRRQSYSSLLVRLEGPGSIQALAAWVEQDRRLKLEVIGEPAYFQEQARVGAPIQALGDLITVILTLGAVFAAMNTMYGAVAGRTAEIGTLRALGFRRREILASFQLECVLLCGLGGFLGACMALGCNGIHTGTTNFETFSDLSFQFTITPHLMLKGTAFGLLMGLLGGFLPAWRASRLPITVAMGGG